ncbi:MAG: hypothetical protein Tp182DCM212571_72 [Prokaryotic dsDNA virus sp.]|nr:MAG: hypothetical protein Tp182DCM212571_72 [Prokaryotic dsDNA virus sp.]
MRWTKISCAEYEEHLSIMGDDKRVYSGFTDLTGQFGEPRIETIWCRKETPDEPLLKSVRHPAYWDDSDVTPKPDRYSCEHYFAGAW